MDQTQRQQQEQAQDLHQIQDQIRQQGIMLKELSTKFDQMLFQMVGNELDKETGGLIKRVNGLDRRVDMEVERLEARITSLERFRDRLMVIVVVFAALGGFGASELIKLFK